MRNLCSSKNMTNRRTENPCDPRATLAGVNLQQFLIKTIFNFTFSIEP